MENSYFFFRQMARLNGELIEMLCNIALLNGEMMRNV